MLGEWRLETERKREGCNQNISVAAAAATSCALSLTQPFFNPSTYFHTKKTKHSSDFAASFLPAFRASNPHMEVLEEVRAGHHPYLRGEYREFS